MAFQLNIWSAVFLVSIAQGLFLLLLLYRSKLRNKAAKLFLSLLLAVFMVTNLEYLFTASAIFKVIPHLFGISNGLILLMGPLFLFYIKATLDGRFKLQWKDLLHLLPYAVAFVINLPVLVLSFNDKIGFINVFISGQLPFSAFWLVYFGLQCVHLGIYLWLCYKRLQNVTKALFPAAQWQRRVAAVITGYGVTVLCLLVFTALSQRFSLYANYVYTLCMSVATYFLAYSVLLDGKVVLPDFKKRNAANSLVGKEETEQLKNKLEEFMNENKPFLNPDYRLANLADDMQIQKHVLSQFLNNELGLSFSDYINSYRIEELKQRFSQARYSHITIYGLALDVGFNSKSSFNAAFKKHTGITPRSYKKQG